MYFKELSNNFNFVGKLNRGIKASLYQSSSTSIKPYILESKLLKRINKVIDTGSSNNLMLSQNELKQAVRNRVLDLTYEQLAELNTLDDSEAYEAVLNKIPNKYLNLY
jgi:hypothetical protein